MSERILVVAPHGLDEVLGCGGTIARFAKAGSIVDLIVMFGDGTGRDQARREATHLAADILGISAVHFGGLPENVSDTIPLVEMIGVLENIAIETAPTTVYVCHSGSLHIDHENSFRAVITAFRPTPGHTVKAIYAYEIQSSTDWAPSDINPFTPNRYVDVSGTLELKLNALRVYGDEMRAVPHARSIESAEHLARGRGATVGVQAAEAFVVVRLIT